jgi:hypothetical protein
MAGKPQESEDGSRMAGSGHKSTGRVVADLRPFGPHPQRAGRFFVMIKEN